MNTVEFTAAVAAGSVIAGLLGSLTGLGGGVIITPMLTMLFGVDIRYAIGASLVSAIATSSGAAAAYVREGYTNMRIGMLLEVATTSGAILGAYIAGWLSTSTVAVVFGLVLIVSAYLTQRPHHAEVVAESDRLANSLRLGSDYPVSGGRQKYGVRNVPFGFGIMGVAGVVSGLLGIGSGSVKVLAMDQAMHLPFKVSTTTSNFMIGVTAAASAGVYLGRGYLDPVLSMPVVLGVLLGSAIGTRVLVQARTKSLRLIFGVVIAVLGVEMIYKGFTGGL